MKFGYNSEGKLVPLDELELRSRLEELESGLDNREPADRAEDVARLRRVLVADGQGLTEEDENVFSLYREGVLDFHNIERHFGERLSKALGSPGGGSE